MTHPASAAFISYLLIIDLCRVVPRLCYPKFSHFPLKPLLSRPQVNFKCLTQWSMFSCYFFFNLLALFIRVVHLLLPEKKMFHLYYRVLLFLASLPPAVLPYTMCDLCVWLYSDVIFSFKIFIYLALWHVGS